MEYWSLVFGFFVIALIYSSVGFGGGSSYLALLSLPVFALGPEVIRPTALLCNIVVVSGSSLLYIKRKELKFSTWWPYVVLGVPCAIIGGWLPIQDKIFYWLLAVTLLLSSILLWIGDSKESDYRSSPSNPVFKSVIGGGIGLLSGLVSIGGGIFLSPILHLLKWEVARTISGITSIFILFNSVGGIIGRLSNNLNPLDLNFSGPILIAVIIGGQIGSRMGSLKFNPEKIRKVTAAIIFIAVLTILKSRLGVI